jgi:hypothetical protein
MFVALQFFTVLTLQQAVEGLAPLNPILATGFNAKMCIKK